MEELEQTSNLVTLGGEAQEVLRKVCEEQGINQEAVQAAVNNLAVVCVYSVEQIANAFAALRDSLAEVVTPAVRALAEQIASILPTEDAFFMVPPHIRHLAYNHPKARVRNKNWNRMWKIRERYMKWLKD
jgi:hypothetical protein